jgi:mono/diheme cytochrome c family protein
MKRALVQPSKVANGFRIAMTLLFCGIASPTTLAADAGAPDTARGQILYEAHCGACHTPGIHYRADTLPMSRDDLRGLVDVFRRQAGVAWTPEEVEEVVEYLNRTRYHFPRR